MNICVYCSSRNKGSEPYKDVTITLGRSIAQEGDTLVYGGATGGLMDSISTGAKEIGGQIIGVIPKKIIEIGRLSSVCSQLIEVKDMSERKDVMQDISDVFVALPGGIGTMDEVFDTMSKSMLGYFNKKTIIVNIDGYWDALIEQLSTMQEAHMGKTNGFLYIVNDIEECITLLRTIKSGK